MLETVAARVRVTGGRGEAVAADGGADRAGRFDRRLHDDAQELLDVARRRERLAEAGDGDAQPAALGVQLREPRLQLVGHVVEGAAEGCKLVGAGDGDALTEPTLCDPSRGVGEAAKRVHDRATFDERDEGDERECADQPQEKTVALRGARCVDLRLRREDGETNRGRAGEWRPGERAIPRSADAHGLELARSDRDRPGERGAGGDDAAADEDREFPARTQPGRETGIEPN